MFECDGLGPATVRLDPDAAGAGAGAVSSTHRPLVEGVAHPTLGQRLDGAVLCCPGGGGDDLHLLAVPALAAHNEQGGVTWQ